MLRTIPKPARPAWALAALLVAGPAARAVEASAWTVIDRAVAQDRGPGPQHWQVWQVDYRLRLDGPTGVVVTPSEVSATVQGWVSNSRVPAHAMPKWSTLTISGTSGLVATADVIEAADDAQRCRERATLQVWADDDPDGPPPLTPPAKADDKPATPERRPIVSLAPGANLRVRLRLEHHHFLYGPYDPLLGRRSLELRLGPAVLRDTLPLDREHRVMQAAFVINETLKPVAPDAEKDKEDARPKAASRHDLGCRVPADRRDCRQFVSAPDSLHLEAHVPGNQYYRFPEQPVRYSTRVRLRYWYLIAPGTEGECRARVAQYKDTPTAWKVLSDGGREECLTTVGRWVHVERTFRTEADATTLALDFRIVGSDVGELWIDDVTLEPVDADPEAP